ncbi:MULTISPECIES: phosphogluconate dehydrogenase (NAD(+)-dependent, decarboxylating) [Mycolicibacterium]|jgi:6-phosphogluconate dehydrogenase|uniref:6-phosphogluconate dehydrogenase (Decarboxylating) n=1 Tax=Mycolicibacterium vanbaalenii (strain DSM 7251 / JCM 13017 / BCRC 16820 / KCTC 9966 / NRRL B-24157 / PYR-1) TaxID=350058 RepID=A1T104_MYCVP|nr:MULTISPECIES: decarboxylating 6-phosphogluconate dehydrogenase [Mycolicibacterium]ABM10854.1 6-phosphogluconate dehydrogenase (decarboxylating) [Mycolicibacterium vanbaalenii PYR-1]MCV7129728.1 decarboxylating 6-phosphogluconate dehydrogenase [Mycolicibacterium vanbaalenii PYR-1]MDW5609277.1 decarboxylating 6-phosphogluconate dehydrogenase [Mycolicibacterium sp. D5.8-2]QZT57087.1 decarboxylating 6-phosphogluconate dehydrogenase [Mycolicibacterium austroafricanum]QZY46212.1 decarboxylating 6
MQLGLIGLGKMGFNMRARLRDGGHDVVGFDPRPEVSDVASLADLAARLSAPRVVWVMVPSGTVTDSTISELAGVLSPGDLVIDGGNSRYTEDGRHANLLAEKGIAFIDAGVSGGIWGLTEGYGLMVGGSDADVARAMPIFETLRPPGPLEDGFVHVGPVGAGHFAKMVHNGIEYALMTAYAEGYEMLAAEDLVKDPQAVYQAWTNGTVVRSWLQQLLAKALKEDPSLSDISGYTEDSGEGRWTVEEAIRLRVPVPGIAASLFARFLSRQDESPTMKAVAALRNQFGGHAVKRVSESG